MDMEIVNMLCQLVVSFGIGWTCAGIMSQRLFNLKRVPSAFDTVIAVVCFLCWFGFIFTKKAAQEIRDTRVTTEQVEQ